MQSRKSDGKSFDGETSVKMVVRMPEKLWKDTATIAMLNSFNINELIRAAIREKLETFRSKHTEEQFETASLKVVKNRNARTKSCVK